MITKYYNTFNVYNITIIVSNTHYCFSFSFFLFFLIYITIMIYYAFLVGRLYILSVCKKWTNVLNVIWCINNIKKNKYICLLTSFNITWGPDNISLRVYYTFKSVQNKCLNFLEMKSWYLGKYLKCKK